MWRTGFTIIELIVTLVVIAILGTALTRILINDARFVDRIDANAAARQNARSAMTLMLSELSGVSDGGIVSPTDSTQITFRTPFAFGLTCDTQSGWTYGVLMPSDSVVVADAVMNGMATRTDAGYTFHTSASFQYHGTTAICNADSIFVPPGGALVRMQNLSSTVDLGTPFYLYEQASYSFGSSTTLTGRRALLRTDGNGTTEELVAPFADSAKFRFLVGQSLTAQSTTPSDLDDIFGLELNLTAESVYDTQEDGKPSEFGLQTSVVFRNKVR